MGILGDYLRSAREALGIDLRDAAQQTRISFNYLKALEEEDFSKLPGEVFVKGFLKNYSRFLKLDEAETLKRFVQCRPVPSSAAAVEKEKPMPAAEPEERSRTPIEPFIWGAAICAALLLFLFSGLPGRHSEQPGLDNMAVPLSSGLTETAQAPVAAPGKIYLEIVALEDTWLLVRTDSSPQKKAVLKKGESLIWSADERFILSYGSVAAVKLLLNGEELTIQGAGETPVRDLAVTRTGVVNQPAPVKQAKPVPKPRPAQPVQPEQAGNQGPQVPPAAVQRPASPRPASAVLPASPPVPAPAVPAPQKPETQPSAEAGTTPAPGSAPATSARPRAPERESAPGIEKPLPAAPASPAVSTGAAVSEAPIQ